jgi:hypothetical protein
MKTANEGSEGLEYERSDFPFKTKYVHTLRVTIKGRNKIYITNEETFRRIQNWHCTSIAIRNYGGTIKLNLNKCLQNKDAINRTKSTCFNTLCGL